MQRLATTLDRADAATLLATAEAPAVLPFEPEKWPIGAAMLQFPTVTSDGRSVREAGPAKWTSELKKISGEGFTSVEIPSNWLPLGDMRRQDLEDLRRILSDLRLDICATSVVRQSIIGANALENLAATRRAIDAAAVVGSPLVCLGLHEPLREEQRAVTWFWTVPGNTAPCDRETWCLAVSRYQELADHAASVGVAISLELYEATYLGTADSALRFLHDIDKPNVGLNPDIGNLIRAPTKVEPWECMAVKMLPFANYWHVKNYAMAEHPPTNLYFAVPSPMAFGVINYRQAIEFAIANGFKGAFLCEHYGGDGLSISGENRKYIQRILRSIRK